jgi:hypothetical protein
MHTTSRARARHAQRGGHWRVGLATEEPLGSLGDFCVKKVPLGMVGNNSKTWMVLWTGLHRTASAAPPPPPPASPTAATATPTAPAREGCGRMHA